MVPVTATLQGKCTVQSHYNRVSYSEENIEGVQVQTLNTFGIKSNSYTYVKVAAFKEFTAENAVGQYMHISTHTCTLHMHQFEVWS